jgi:hypothetical protein
MAALDAGVPLRDVQIAARHADPRTATIYDRRLQNFDRHAAYVVVAFVASGLSIQIGSTRSTVVTRLMLRSNDATRPTPVVSAHATR